MSELASKPDRYHHELCLHYLHLNPFYGGCLEGFFLTRGISQGDPLPSYLFILCMDYLGQLIEEKCEAKLWTPVKALR